jgi:DNA-directed RNA polymerase specialized sigma24 family protein
MDAESETFVVAAARRGSDHAWRQLFEEHFDAVYQYCLLMAGGRRELAEEIAQQVFVTVARQIEMFRPERGFFRAWLLGIARNRYLTIETKERRRRRHEAQSPAGRPAPRDGGPDLHVHETLARLPSSYRRVLECKYLKRLTMKEMAESDGMTIEAIESLLRRARDRFARAYEQVRNED